MMKYILIVMAIFFSCHSYSTEPEEIERLKVKCEREKSSHFRNPRTPICDRLEKILLYEEKMKNVPKNDAAYMQWHGGMETYCVYNGRGEQLSCF